MRRRQPPSSTSFVSSRQSGHAPTPASSQLEADTSWQEVSEWYHQLVGQSGHHYHQAVIFPALSRIWRPTPTTTVLDVGCGQGILSAWLGQTVTYVGIDAASSLVKKAQQLCHWQHHRFLVGDATKGLEICTQPPLPTAFSDAFFVLSLQNMANQQVALAAAVAVLQPGGRLHLILNHPYFRIPRQTGWGEHSGSRQQYRWVNRYLTPLKIPITMQPSSPRGPMTWSFHHALQDYSQWLHQAGCVITLIQEWSSDKHSKGVVAAQENLGRQEIPLFMYVQVLKLPAL